MKTRNKQMQRIVYFLDEVKKGNHPNAHSFSQKLKSLDSRNDTNLACSEKTIKRDIHYLINDMGAPVDYDASEKGYYLWNPTWSLPEVTLSADELFAELFVKKISEEHLLPCLREHLNAGTDIQLRATDQEDINIPALASVIHVTGQHKNIDAQVSEQILEDGVSAVSYQSTIVNHLSMRERDVYWRFMLCFYLMGFGRIRLSYLQPSLWLHLLFQHHQPHVRDQNHNLYVLLNQKQQIVLFAQLLDYVYKTHYFLQQY